MECARTICNTAMVGQRTDIESAKKKKGKNKKKKEIISPSNISILLLGVGGYKGEVAMYKYIVKEAVVGKIEIEAEE